jgi:hypothetical protein
LQASKLNAAKRYEEARTYSRTALGLSIASIVIGIAAIVTFCAVYIPLMQKAYKNDLEEAYHSYDG